MISTLETAKEYWKVRESTLITVVKFNLEEHTPVKAFSDWTLTVVANGATVLLVHRNN